MSRGKSGGPLVCGFSDMASGLAGLAWELAGGGGLLLNEGEVAAAETEISLEDQTPSLRMKAGSLAVEAGLAPHTEPVALEPAEGKAATKVRAATCTATVKSDGRTLQCPGHLSRWDDDPLDGAGTFRHLAIEGPDGSLILLVALGPSGAQGHGEEETFAWTLDPEGGASAFGETFLSTQYDVGGAPTRLGVELWPEGEEQTVRAAATRPSATRIGGLQDGGLSAALFRSHTDGANGLASYLLWRA
jgi:hypothetical protein